MLTLKGLHFPFKAVQLLSEVANVAVETPSLNSIKATSLILWLSAI